MGLGGLISGPLQATVGAQAAGQASQQQMMAGLLGIQAQQQMFGQAQGALKPYYSAGQSVLPTLQSLLTPGASQTQTLSQLPGFQFQSQWGDMATQNALSAQGLGGSAGPLSKALSDYNQGLAGTSFNNLVSQLQGFGNMGETAAGQLGGIATQTGSNIANSFGQVGQAQAAGTLGQANALIGGAGQFANSLGNAALLGSIGGGGGGTGLYGNITSGLMGLGQGGLTGAGWGQQ